MAGHPSLALAPAARGPLTRSIYLTGATGVIGRQLIPLLLQAGHRVTAVGRTPLKRIELARMGVRPVATDLFDPIDIRRSLRDAEVIINLATAVPPPWALLWPRAWRPMDRVRREISANLALAAIEHGGIGRLIQESFAGVLADGGDRWLDETREVRPASYNRSVLDAERNAGEFASNGRVAVILRFALFYGPDDPMTLQLLRSIRRGWYPMPGDPEGYSSWVSHTDAARAVVAALEAPGGTYHVVDDLPMTRRKLAESLARAMGRPAPRFLPRWLARWSGPVGETMARSHRLSNARFKSVTRWAPRERNVLEGLRRPVALIGSRP